eukprot:scaffold742_cov395-Prasinococcus_capsulatus_cf.AAC.19
MLDTSGTQPELLVLRACHTTDQPARQTTHPLPTLKPPKPLLFASREPGDACVTGTGGFGVEDLMPPTDRFIGPLLLLVFLNLSPKFELTKSAKLSPASIVATLMRCRLYALSHELAAELAATKAILHFQPHSRHGRLPPVDNSPQPPRPLRLARSGQEATKVRRRTRSELQFRRTCTSLQGANSPARRWGRGTTGRRTPIQSGRGPKRHLPTSFYITIARATECALDWRMLDAGESARARPGHVEWADWERDAARRGAARRGGERDEERCSRGGRGPGAAAEGHIVAWQRQARRSARAPGSCVREQSVQSVSCRAPPPGWASVGVGGGAFLGSFCGARRATGAGPAARRSLM